MQNLVDDAGSPDALGAGSEAAASVADPSADPAPASRGLPVGLALPFAFVGAAGGWLSAGFLANPLVRVTLGDDRALAAACAGVVAALLGAALTRLCVEDGSRLRTPAVIWARLVLAVLAGGAVSGAAVGVASVGTPDGAITGAINGSICSVAFVPVCALVLAAARRARRARLGSIVARADRRAVWSILAAALAVTTLAALPDWPASIEGLAPEPTVAVALGAAAGLVLLATLAADVVAIAAIARAASGPDLEERDPEGEREGERVPRIDLGLGDDVRARLARGASAYRTRERALALLLGSPAQARAALRRAIARGAAGALLVAAVLGLQAAAASTAGSLWYSEIRCDGGVGRACRTAAILSRIRDRDDDSGRSAALHVRACEAGQVMSCAALARMQEERARSSRRR